MSAEGAIDRELASIGAWLAAQSAEVRCAGLQRALALLSSRGATLH